MYDQIRNHIDCQKTLGLKITFVILYILLDWQVLFIHTSSIQINMFILIAVFHNKQKICHFASLKNRPK